MTRRPQPATIPAQATLQCPRCRHTITTTLPLRAAACHNQHPWTHMRIVDTATADESDR